MARILCMALMIQLSLADQCRNAFKKQSETEVLKLLTELEDKEGKSATEQCYEAAFLCLKADYSSNPYTKYNAFKSGYGQLNKLIRVYPTNVEFRYHRYMIETNAPSFLIDESHTKQDKLFIIAKRESSHPLYELMKTI